MYYDRRWRFSLLHDLLGEDVSVSVSSDALFFVIAMWSDRAHAPFVMSFACTPSYKLSHV